MHVKAALLREVPGQWEVCNVELDEPRAHEVLVRIVASGLCHTDDHFATGDIGVAHLPLCGGHEAAGVVEAVGPNVEHLAPGDHVVTTFLPPCGHCRWCASGQQYLCDNGAHIGTGALMDGTHRMHYEGTGVAQFSMLGAFAEYSVIPARSCVKIDADIPLEVAALVGCGVPTGWGSAQNAAQVQPGDVVIVMGVGGVGTAAVQGARHAAAAHVIAVDPVDFKRTTALQLGATEAFGDIAEAADFARSVTNGQGADSVIITLGVLDGGHLTAALAAVSKGGIVVLTSAATQTPDELTMSLLELTMYGKRIQGAVCGMTSADRDTPRLLNLWRNGHLKLEEMLTRTYAIEDINTGFEDLKAGRNIRGLISFGDAQGLPRAGSATEAAVS